jgi:hypothetical protein
MDPISAWLEISAEDYAGRELALLGSATPRLGGKGLVAAQERASKRLLKRRDDA